MEPRQFGLCMAALALLLITVRRMSLGAAVTVADSEPQLDCSGERGTWDRRQRHRCCSVKGLCHAGPRPGSEEARAGEAAAEVSGTRKVSKSTIIAQQAARVVLADPPSLTAPSPDEPEPAAQPTHPPSPPPLSHPPPPLEETDSKPWNGRSPNPYIDKYVTPAVREYWAELKKRRKANADEIQALYGGGFCPRERPYITATDCWQKEPDLEKRGTRDDQPAGTDWDVRFTKMASCECDGGHRQDNQSNWDSSRRAFCTGLKGVPVPSELGHVLDLNFGDPLTPDGMLSQKFAAPFPSGPAAGELGWDPATVKAHFLKLRAALTMYYQGEQNLDAQFRARPGESEQYAEVIHALSQKFAAALVHGGSFVIGAMGDSTVAGQDNCAFDAWPYGVERQLQPLLAAAGVNLTVNNVGHNGGWPTNPQLACSGNLVGYDADLVILSTPYVRPAGASFAHLQFVRRTLLAGAIPLLATGELRQDKWNEEIAKYAKLGVAVGTNSLSGTWVEGWWPTNTGDHNPFWGRVGDGLCHAFRTRSGSAAVINRNWHPGPMGHQILQDRISFFYADAIIKAIEHIEKAVRVDGGKLGPLRKRWPRRTPLPPDALPGKTEWCGNEKSANSAIAAETAAKRLFCGAADEVGHARCATGLLPTHGTLLQDWHVDVASGPDWGEPAAGSGSGSGGKAWEIDRRGGGAPRWWKGDGVFSFVTCNSCYGAQSRANTWETNRSVEACIGQDWDDSYQANETPEHPKDESSKMGWLTFKIPARTMRVGHISICGVCQDPDPANDHANTAPSVKLRGEGLKAEAGSGLVFEWWQDDWGSGERDKNKKGGKMCATVVRTLPAPTLANDVLLGIHCRSGRLQYITTL